jgi:peptidoglycan/xylan/chitin deacetylase (PgdA/CDA1 family)
MTNNLIITIRRSISTILGQFDVVLKREKIYPVILNYHSIGSDRWFHTVTKEEFKKQIDYLAGNCTFIELNDLYLWMKGKKDLPRNAVVLTFDDGYRNILTVKTFLSKYNIKPGLFLLSEPKKVERKELGSDLELLSTGDIKELIDAGWIIGCHSATHTNFFTLNEEQIKNEVITAKDNLQKEIGTQIRYFAYPRGRYTQKVIDGIKKAGYVLGLSMDDGSITAQTDLFRIARIGVNRSHNIEEFRLLNSPSVILMRKLFKKFIDIN